MNRFCLFSIAIIFSISTVSCSQAGEEKIEYHIVTFKTGGGTKIEPQQVKHGDTVKRPPDPKREGFTFGKWTYKDKAWSFPNNTVTQDITLTATWVTNDYNLTLQNDNKKAGTISANKEGPFAYGSYVTLTANPNWSFIFDGWYDGTSGELISKDNPYRHQTGLDQTIVAKWTRDKEAALAKTPVQLSSDKYWPTFAYGIYPQTHVSDESLISALNALQSPDPNTGWYYYKNEYFAKQVANNYYRDSSYRFDDGTPMVYGEEYWFKCEPIYWRGLEQKNGVYYLLANTLLDVHCYYHDNLNRTIDEKTIYPNNYKHSDVRSWLTGYFYDSAFKLNNRNVVTASVDNSLSTSSVSQHNGVKDELCASENTSDKVFLPSFKDYFYDANGYWIHDLDPTATVFTYQRCYTTDWSRARGAWCASNGLGYFWSRSPVLDSQHLVWCVNTKDEKDDAIVFNDSQYLSGDAISVRPAIKMRL